MRPDEPGSGDGDEEKQIRPMKQPPETHPRLPKKKREEQANGRQVKKGSWTFCQAGKSAAQPRTGEPGPAEFSALISANNAVDRAGDEEGEEGVRRDHSPEQERTAGTKMNQAGSEPAPITSQPFTKEKGERDRCDHRERNRNPRRGRGHAENFGGERNYPISERRSL